MWENYKRRSFEMVINELLDRGLIRDIPLVNWSDTCLQIAIIQ